MAQMSNGHWLVKISRTVTIGMTFRCTCATMLYSIVYTPLAIIRHTQICKSCANKKNGYARFQKQYTWILFSHSFSYNSAVYRWWRLLYINVNECKWINLLMLGYDNCFMLHKAKEHKIFIFLHLWILVEHYTATTFLIAKNINEENNI